MGEPINSTRDLEVLFLFFFLFLLPDIVVGVLLFRELMVELLQSLLKPIQLHRFTLCQLRDGIFAWIALKFSFDKQSTMWAARSLGAMDIEDYPNLLMCQQAHAEHSMQSCCGGNKTIVLSVPFGHMWHFCHCAKVSFQCVSWKSVSLLLLEMPK